jgi:DNA-binding XRE family transcriptional regulator
MALRYIIAAKKAPIPTDHHVGARVRMRRKMLAIGQQKLADALGITYQQVQKYEKGATRIAAGREACYRRPRLMTSSPIQTA